MKLVILKKKPPHWTYTKEQLSLGQPLRVVDLEEPYNTLETAHLRALTGAVSESGVPHRGAVRLSERPQLAVVG